MFKYVKNYLDDHPTWYTWNLETRNLVSMKHGETMVKPW
jgi:hypothetical protein